MFLIEEELKNLVAHLHETHWWPGWGIASYLYSQPRIQNLRWPAEQDFQVLSRPLPSSLSRFPIPHISSSSSFMDNNYFGHHSVRCQGALFPPPPSKGFVRRDRWQKVNAFARVIFLFFFFSRLFWLQLSFFSDSFNFRIGEIGLLLVVWKSRLRTLDSAANELEVCMTF